MHQQRVFGRIGRKTSYFFPVVISAVVIVVKTTSVKSVLIKTGRIRTVSMAHNGPESRMDGDYRGQSEDTRHIIIKYSLE